MIEECACLIDDYTSDEKLKWFGYGEWVEEPDEVLFTYKDYQCKIKRVVQQEPFHPDVYFGGHLCGYVKIPADHPYHYKIFELMNIECHGGLTYGKCEIGHWIGFDCAHIGDYVPSVEFDKRKSPYRSISSIPEEFMEYALFNPTYKNRGFCENECKKIVDQLIMADSLQRKINGIKNDTFL